MKMVHYRCSTCRVTVVVGTTGLTLERDAEGYFLRCPACGKADGFDDWSVLKLEQLFPRGFEPPL